MKGNLLEKRIKWTVFFCVASSIIVWCVYGITQTKVKEEQYYTCESEVIIYKHNKYEVIPSDLINTNNIYGKKLDNLGMNYDVNKIELCGIVKKVDGGGKIYETKHGYDEVMVLEDKQGEYSYIFKL